MTMHSEHGDQRTSSKVQLATLVFIIAVGVAITAIWFYFRW
jgi:hypothetical protein